MNMKRLYSSALAAVMAIGILFAGAAPAAADHNKASSKEKAYRLGTYALGGLTAYGLVKKKGTLALVGAAGTYLAYRGWKNEVNERHERRRDGRNYRRHDRRARRR